MVHNVWIDIDLIIPNKTRNIKSKKLPKTGGRYPAVRFFPIKKAGAVEASAGELNNKDLFTNHNIKLKSAEN